MFVVKFVNLLNVMLGQQFDSAAMQKLSTAIKIRTHQNFRTTVSAYDKDCFFVNTAAYMFWIFNT